MTWQRLAEMLSYLPSRQYRGLWFLLGISTAVGLADLVFVGLIARLVGSFSGSSLVDNLPFVRVFGGDALDSGLWIVGLLLGLIWFSTALKFLSRLVEARVSSAVWAVLGNQVYGNLILQTYDYFKDSSSTKLLTRLNRVLSKVSDGVVLPLLAIKRPSNCSSTKASKSLRNPASLARSLARSLSRFSPSTAPSINPENPWA